MLRIARQIRLMGKVIKSDRWTKAKAATPPRRGIRWFPALMVALPLGVFSAIFFAPDFGNGINAEAATGNSRPVDREDAHFHICSGPVRVTCVVDGDTIWYRGEKIRLVGFDAPEISNPGCTRERRLGERAKLRLRDWLHEGAFSFSPNPDGRSEDRYGRSLRVVSRRGANVAGVMLAEGLAERRGGRANAWC